MMGLESFFQHTLIGQTLLGYLLMFTVPLSFPIILITLIGARGLRHLFSYEPRQTWVHKLDPRIKVIYPVLVGGLSVLLNWNFVYLLLLFTVIPWILVKPSGQRTRVVLAMICTPAIGIIWSQGMFYIPTASAPHLLFTFPPTLNWLGTPGISREGLLNGTQQAGRVLVATSATLILLMITKPSEIIWAFAKFRIPASIGLAVTVALRFLPQLIERTTVLLQAMQVRGYDLSRPRWREITAWPGYIRRIGAALPVMTVPLLIGSLRSTSITAMVVDARAFGAECKRTFIHEHKMISNDYIALSAFVLLIVSVSLLLILHIATRQG